MTAKAIIARIAGVALALNAAYGTYKEIWGKAGDIATRSHQNPSLEGALYGVGYDAYAILLSSAFVFFLASLGYAMLDFGDDSPTLSVLGGIIGLWTGFVAGVWAYGIPATKMETIIFVGVAWIINLALSAVGVFIDTEVRPALVLSIPVSQVMAVLLLAQWFGKAIPPPAFPIDPHLYPHIGALSVAIPIVLALKWCHDYVQELAQP
jgi:hypothetical protein